MTLSSLCLTFIIHFYVRKLLSQSKRKKENHGIFWMYVRRFHRICYNCDFGGVWSHLPAAAVRKFVRESSARSQLKASDIDAVLLRWDRWGEEWEKQAVMSTSGLLRDNAGSRWSDGEVTRRSCTTAGSPTAARNAGHLVDGGQEANINKRIQKKKYSLILDEVKCTDYVFK